MFPPAAGRLILLQFPIKAIFPPESISTSAHTWISIIASISSSPSHPMFRLIISFHSTLAYLTFYHAWIIHSSSSTFHLIPGVIFSRFTVECSLFLPLTDSMTHRHPLSLYYDQIVICSIKIGVKKSKVTSIGPPCMIVVIIVYCTWSEQEKSCNHSGPGYNSCSSWWMWPRMPGMVRWKYQEHWSKKPEVNWSCCYVLYHRRHHWMKIMRWNDEGKEPDDTINRRARHPPELVHGLFLLYQT